MTEESLKRKRGAIKAKLTAFSKYILTIDDKIANGEELTNGDHIILEDRITRADRYMQEYEDIQIEIELVTVDADLDNEYKEREEFETLWYKELSKAKVIRHSHQSAHVENCPTVATSAVSSEKNFSVQYNNKNNVKLPTIQLPKFNGYFHNWLEFRDTYESLIHENDTITEIQKFHYLRASVEGTAAQVIKSIEFSAKNYGMAWDTLKQRFNNTKLLIHNHIKSLFNLELVQKESSFKIRKLIDDVSKNIRSLQQLGQPVEHWDTLIIFMIVSKLDASTAREWEQFKVGNDVPSLEDLKSFLKSKADLLETLESKNAEKKHVKYQVGNTKSFFVNNSNCVVCKQGHYVNSCSEFLKLTPEDRQTRVKELKLCLNCLKVGHFNKFCRLKPCKLCNRKHHSLLHVSKDIATNEKEVENNNTDNASENTMVLNSYSVVERTVLLSTALIYIRDKNNQIRTARAVLDSGSQSSFISENLCTSLGLEKSEVKVAVSALNNINFPIKHKCEARIQSMRHDFSCNVDFLVVAEVAGNIPNIKINVKNLNIPRELLLADPSFNEPARIDLLLGVDVFWNLIKSGQRKLGLNRPILQNSQLGWLVSGPVASTGVKTVNCNFVRNLDIQQTLVRFWEIEEVNNKSNLSPDEQKCEQHYVENTIRDASGRFVVSLPLCDSLDKLGSSYEHAVKRFLSLEKRLQNNPVLKDMYCKFMNEYIQLGHMSLVNPKDHVKYVYFMPHHGVIKQDSSTTKLRVVFDASAPTTSGYSLNNLQLKGPTIQNDLSSILLRFRKYNVVVAADIEKMYRQVIVNEKDRPLQRIVWRDEHTKQLDAYNLVTVTYGTTAAPFLAIRSLTQLANDIEATNPVIAQVIKNDFYVDDMLTGFDNIESANATCENIIDALLRGGFKLRKFYSNKSNILKDLDRSNADNLFVDFSNNENTKTLGIIWSPENDILKYNVSKSVSCSRVVTKRSILSVISQIFDPLGLIGPCIIVVKIMLQKLWLEKLSWDDSVPIDRKEEWLNFIKELPLLDNLKINRQVTCSNPVRTEIHGFSDASSQAYGACIYLRTTSKSGSVQTHLLCAKSKVCPVKSITIPKLELCAALMLSRLLQKVNESLKMEIKDNILWSDSTIVLWWLKKHPNTLKTFVGNRVSEIQELAVNAQWRYVASTENPADLISRGVSPRNIINSNLWWFGPIWLSKPRNEWPTMKVDIAVDPMETRTPVQCFNVSCDTPFYESFSKLSRLKRVVAYMLRYRYNCKNKQNKTVGPLKVDELHKAFVLIVKVAQGKSFANEIRCLNNQKLLPRNSRLRSLNPIIDNDGLLRVGGRLDNSEFDFHKKHPIILDNKDHLTKLIFVCEHERLFHAGPQLLLSNIREKFWPLSGRNLAKKTVHSCVRCERISPKLTQPLMGSLPRERLEVGFPFGVVGVDYAGPFVIKDRKGRGCKTSKCYVCIFVCFSVKAIHTELVTDLTKDAFIFALRRFVARRGKPRKIFSDNGTNFVAAHKKLRELAKFFLSNAQTLQESFANEGITWEFIPPHSPHFGGLWESGVKTIKYHLKRVVGVKLLTFEEFYTFLVQIESIVNSRPLSPLSTDPQDLTPLTPAHFLIGRLLTAIPDEDFLEVPETKLIHSYQHIQKMRQHFWQRWSKEYVSQLQIRVKWQQHQNDLREDTLVLIKEDGVPPMKWRLGRVLSVCPGRDGINRVAVVKTQDGTMKRSFSKICPLPIP